MTQAFMQRRLYQRSLAGALLLLVLSFPYLAAGSDSSALLTTRCLVLFPLLTFGLAVSLTGQPKAAPGRTRASADAFRWYWVAFGCTAAAIIWALSLDPALQHLGEVAFPSDWRTLLIRLPWQAATQPLLLVSLPCAAIRLYTKRSSAGIAAVVLLHQGLVFIQSFHHSSEASPAFLFAVGVTAGLRALILGTVFCASGVKGMVVAAAILHLRHAFHMAFPNLFL